MPSESDQPNGERERYERIAAASHRLLALLVEGPPDNPLDLVVEMVNALLKDAQELETTASGMRTDIRRDLFVLRADQASADPARSSALARTVAQLAGIDSQLEARHGTLEQAIGDTRQAFKALAAVEGSPSPALLQEITRALEAIQTCSADLNQLGHERVRAVAGLTRTTPGDAVAPQDRVTPSRVMPMPAPQVEPPAPPAPPPSATPPSPRIDPPGSVRPFGF